MINLASGMLSTWCVCVGGGGACVRDWEWDVVVVFLVCSFVCLTFFFTIDTV